MQRVLLFVLTLFALYASALAQSLALPDLSPPPASTDKAAPLTTLPNKVKLPDSVIVAEKNSAPHIALLLPIKSTTFGTSANAVQQGFMAAASLDEKALPTRVYSNFDEDKNVTTAYRQAIANGAVAVVGPLTRNGVATLATLQDFPVPTLSLNALDNTLEPNLYFFGLAIEMEARQIAQIAKQKGLTQTIVISSRAPLSKRLQAAFEDEWNNLGGKILREIEYADDPAIFEGLVDTPDTFVFLATDVDKARFIRPYLLVQREANKDIAQPKADENAEPKPTKLTMSKLPIYATSRVFLGNENTLVNFDLSDIRFIDMPWLLQADHLAVMTYPRATSPLSIDNERLYALGIDAFRLTQLLLARNITGALPLDGVSGQIQLRNHTFQRAATPAIFVEGRAQLNDAPIIRNMNFPFTPPNITP